jgi:serine/threonine protein kinase
LARAFVQAGKITRYQAAMLLQGRTRGFLMGNYVILDKLGAGGMGMVFKARHLRMNRDVAIKLLPPDRMKKAAAIRRFQREVETAARLSHPHIVAAYDADKAKGVHFLVMEFVDGDDLQRHVAKHGPLSVPHAVSCIVQAARGLEYAHAEGIVHRDITPANLLLERSGTVKILDMGLAHVEEHAPPTSGAAGENSILGTVDYLSPEQAAHPNAVDGRSDIYSLGCTFAYLLTGRPLYGGESALDKLLAHRDAPIPSLREIRPEAPDELDRVFQRMVAKEPSQRYSTMSELIDDLEAIPLVAVDGQDFESSEYAAEPDDPWDFSDNPAVGTIDSARDTASDVRTIQPAAISIRPTPRRIRRPRAIWASVLIVVALLAFLLARGQLEYGSVAVAPEDARAERFLAESGLTVLDPVEQRVYVLRSGTQKLKPGTYILAADSIEQVDVAPQRITVKGNGEVRIRVRAKPRS